jgi:hypothetical protein
LAHPANDPSDRGLGKKISAARDWEPMRQGQQNRRGRGRNNNSGRKHQNPLTRTFESNGPDVKIRGTPAHVAEKYVTLARDALASGDPVLAENYLQHAEHYNRIIMSYREQQAQQQSEQPRVRHDQDQQPGHVNDAGDDGDDSQPPAHNGSNGANGAHHNGNGSDSDEPSARADGGNEDEVAGGGDRPRRQPRGRNPRGRRQRPERTASGQDAEGGEGDDEASEQPDFLTRPIKRSRKSESGDDNATTTEAHNEPADQPVE